MRLGILVALCAVLAASCASTGSPTPVPTAVPSPTPTPSPTPFDLAGTFLAKLQGAESLGMEITGSVTVGDVVSRISGTATISGTDSDTESTVGDDPHTRTETISTAGVRYQQTDVGQWFQIAGETPGPDLAARLRKLNGLSDAGTETKEGRILHRLELPSGTTISASALGLGEPILRDAVLSLVFFAGDDGTPTDLTASGMWSQWRGNAKVQAHLEVDFRIVRFGAATVSAPAQVWQVLSSARFAYLIGYPEGWLSDTSNAHGDQIYLPSHRSLLIGRTLQPASATLDALVKAEVDFATKNGAKLRARDVFFVDGTTAALLLFDRTTKEPTFDVLVALEGRYYYYALWDGPLVYAEPADTSLFTDILQTFAFDRNVWGLQPGQCFNASAPIAGSAGELGLFVGGVDGFVPVECVSPHSGEVIAVLARADQDCKPFFATYVGRALSGSRLSLMVFVPVSADIPPPHVAAMCVVADPSGSRTGSAAGSGG